MNIIINLNKPSGMSSQQAVTRVKRLFAASKAGHTGTLDPLATGVLLVCLNEATKISRFFLDMDKKYKARVKLGERTDTYDSEGRVTEVRDVSSTTEVALVNVATAFRGKIKQTPPMFSAVKIKGETLYKLARKGVEIERPERIVEIYDLRISDISFPYFEMEVSCSKGTYIRSLCDDIGLRLGTGAHLVSLERTGIGPFEIKDAVTLDDLRLEYSGDIKTSLPDKEYFCSPDAALSGLKELHLDERTFRSAMDGVAFADNGSLMLTGEEFLRLKGPGGNLFGIGRKNNGKIRVERILKL